MFKVGDKVKITKDRRGTFTGHITSARNCGQDNCYQIDPASKCDCEFAVDACEFLLWAFEMELIPEDHEDIPCEYPGLFGSKRVICPELFASFGCDNCYEDAGSCEYCRHNEE